MEDETRYMNVEDGIEVPEPGVLRVERLSRHGSIPYLRDSELADVRKLEQAVYREMWKPLMVLPKPVRNWRPYAKLDADGRLDWGAFGTVDFERMHGHGCPWTYREQQIRDDLMHATIMLEMVEERLPRHTQLPVLRLVRQGVLDIDDIENPHMHAIARWDTRVRRLRQELRTLQEARRSRLAPDDPP